jgi:putative endopeptidase
MKSKLALLAGSAILMFALAADAANMAPADPLASPKYGTWGYDASGMDRSVKPGTDFFRYANGKWIERTEIPPDRPNTGMFYLLRQLAEQRVRDIIERASTGTGAGHDAEVVGVLYRSYMDEARVEALDAKPIEPELAAIRAARTRTDIARLMGESNEGIGSSMFPMFVNTDAKRPDTWALVMVQGGIGLPDKDYFTDAQFATHREKYKAYIATLLKYLNWPDAGKQAAAVYALEEAIAKVHWTQAESRDDEKTYNPMTPAELAAKAPGFDWKAYFTGARVPDLKFAVVSQPSAIAGEAAIIGKADMDTLRAWLAFHLADNASPFLSRRFADANFEFREKTLNGVPQQRDRWKRAVKFIDDSIPQALGKLYVAKYFTPQAKARMEALVKNVLAAMKDRIERLDWMSPQTKAVALQKLANFTVHIGFPERWRDFSRLELSPTDLVGNGRRIAAHEWAFYRGKIGGPVDKGEWILGPATVNAWNRSSQNDITFPAGILQPPFFDPDADDAINYGAIGMVIGHEISHGFDDQGRKYDAQGMLRDWWTEADAKGFLAQQGRLGKQFEAIPILPNAKINGDLTMGENIADLAGLLIALDAYHKSLNGKPAPVIDGMTGDQRFFLGFAQVWRAKLREPFMRQILVSDPHSPPVARVNGTVVNMDAWYAAFNIKPGDPMYIAPDQRVRIW